MMPGMLSAIEPIVYSLQFSRDTVRMFTQDLAPQEMLHRTTPKANCAAWLVGHLTLTDRNMLKRLGVNDLPPLPDDDFEKRFSRDEGCPQAEAFGEVSSLLMAFEAHRNRLIAVASSLTPPQLAQPLENPHPRFKTVGELLSFMSLHTCVHAGQMTMIRRSLGRPPVI
jgi:uncharacterized damage-inducible protein DinB